MSLIDKARESEINSYLKLEEDYQLLVDHAQDLERQLEEAREESIKLRVGIDNAMDCLDCDSIAYIILNQLKEQGDE